LQSVASLPRPKVPNEGEDTAGDQLPEDGQRESEHGAGPGLDEDEEQSDEGEGSEGGDGSDMDEGEKAYWAQKAKAGKGAKVGGCLDMFVYLTDTVSTQPKKKSHLTRDLRLCFKKDVRSVNGETRAGEYCLLCL
jgi:hypothetical protein